MKLLCNREMAVRKIDDELFIYNREKSLVHTFNRTGVFLWEAIVAGNSMDEIIVRMVEQFEVDTKKAADDLEEFIIELQKYGLVGKD